MASTGGFPMVYGETNVDGVPIVYAWSTGSGMSPLDYRAQHEGEAIARLGFLVPRNKRVIHASILWNKNRYRAWKQMADHRTAFARAMFSRFFSRTHPRGRKYRQAMKTMGRTTRDKPLILGVNAYTK
jgi:hypothetical protein